MNRRLLWLPLWLAACATDGTTPPPSPPPANTTVSSVTVSPTALSLEPGGKANLGVAVKNAAGETLNTPVTWTSSAPNTAGVNPSSGEVTALTEGTATITAGAGGQSGAATVTVRDNAVATVTVSPASLTLSPGATGVLNATARNAAGRTLTASLTWGSSDPGLATVSAAGVVTAKAPGGVTITATAGGKSGAASLTVPTPTTPSARQTQQSLLSSNANGTQTRLRFWQYLPETYASSTAQYPLLIFLHGAGETSQNDAPSADPTEYPRVLVHGPPKLVKNNTDLCFTVNAVRSCFIVLSPQAPKADGWWNVSRIRALLDYAKAKLRVDSKRIYLTGLSMGGGGTWNFAASQSFNPTAFYASELAAIVPIAGASSSSSSTCNLANQSLPVWAFHGTADTTVSPQSSRDFVNVINGVKVGNLQCTANPVKALLTEYAGVGHDSWTQTFDPSKRFNPTTAQPDAAGVNIYEWMLSQHR